MNGTGHMIVIVRKRRSRWLRWQHRLILYVDGHEILAWNEIRGPQTALVHFSPETNAISQVLIARNRR